jgi:hypothetical protein
MHIISDKYNYFLDELYDFEAIKSADKLEFTDDKIKKVISIIEMHTKSKSVNSNEDIKYSEITNQSSKDADINEKEINDVQKDNRIKLEMEI